MKTVFALLTYIFAACGAAFMTAIPPANPLPFIQNWVWFCVAIFIYAVLAGAFTACAMVQVWLAVVAFPAFLDSRGFDPQLCGGSTCKGAAEIRHLVAP